MVSAACTCITRLHGLGQIASCRHNSSPTEGFEMALTALPDPTEVKPVEVLRTNDYSEGPVVDRNGNIYFSHERLITRLAPDGSATEWARTTAPNGHKILPNGEHLVCDGQRHAVLRLDASGREVGVA